MFRCRTDIRNKLSFCHLILQLSLGVFGEHNREIQSIHWHDDEDKWEKSWWHLCHIHHRNGHILSHHICVFHRINWLICIQSGERERIWICFLHTFSGCLSLQSIHWSHTRTPSNNFERIHLLCHIDDSWLRVSDRQFLFDKCQIDVRNKQNRMHQVRNWRRISIFPTRRDQETINSR